MKFRFRAPLDSDGGHAPFPFGLKSVRHPTRLVLFVGAAILSVVRIHFVFARDAVRYFYWGDMAREFWIGTMVGFVFLGVLALALKKAKLSLPNSNGFRRAILFMPALFMMAIASAIYIRLNIFRFDFMYYGYVMQVMLGYLGTLIFVLAGVGFLKRKGKDGVAFLAACSILLIVVGLDFGITTYRRIRFHGPIGKGSPNIVFITVDTLRRDELSCYNPAIHSTPHIQGLADDSTKFLRHFSSAPWTLPAFASIMTALPPQVHLTAAYGSRLPDQFITLAEYLRASGYLTSAFVDNLHLKPESNLTQGFNDYEYITTYPNQYMAIPMFPENPWSAFRDRWRSMANLTDLALHWLSRHDSTRFFLWVHYLDPHAPYELIHEIPPSERIQSKIGDTFNQINEARDGNLALSDDDKHWIRKLYGYELSDVDRNIGRILDDLKRRGLYDDSLIVFTTDHGEEFWDHGGYEHGHSLYNELIQIPLLIKLPKRNGPSAPIQIVENITGSLDLLPTFLEAGGVSYDPASIMGRSIYPLLNTGKVSALNADSPAPVFSSTLLYGANQLACIASDGNTFKYVRHLKDGSEKLFDLDADPSEKAPVEKDQEAILSRLRGLADRFIEETHERRENLGIKRGEQTQLDEGTEAQLKALGYL